MHLVPRSLISPREPHQPASSYLWNETVQGPGHLWRSPVGQPLSERRFLLRRKALSRHRLILCRLPIFSTCHYRTWSSNKGGIGLFAGCCPHVRLFLSPTTSRATTPVDRRTRYLFSNTRLSTGTSVSQRSGRWAVPATP